MGEVNGTQHRSTYSAQAISDFAYLIHSPGRIHVDPELARSLGYPHVLAHGVMLLSGIDELMEQEFADDEWFVGRVLRCRFRHPVFAGDDVVTEATPAYSSDGAGRAWSFASSNADGRIVIEGSISDSAS